MYFEGKAAIATAVLAVSLASVIVAIFFLLFVNRSFSKNQIELVSAETADQENVAFLLLYISPLFSTNASALNFTIAIPVIVLFVAVVMAGNNYHFNPLLNLAGWHFYKVNTVDGVSQVLITRRTIRNVLGSRNVVELSNYVLLEVWYWEICTAPCSPRVA
ncbi:MAG: hypothetical protein AAGL10_03905 [Pseudomonadota bacterium]